MDIADEHAALSETAVAALNAAARRSAGQRPVDTRDVLLALLLLEAQADWQMIKRFADTDHMAVARVSDPVRHSGDSWMGVPLTGSCAEALRAALRQARRTASLPVQTGLLAVCLALDLSSAAVQAMDVRGPDQHQDLIKLIPGSLVPLDPKPVPHRHPSSALRRKISRRRKGSRRWLWVVAIVGVLVLLASTLAFIRRAPSDDRFQETLPGGAQVTAKLRHGTPAVSELAETPELITTDPLGPPIHVDPKDALLAEPATITFPVRQLDAGLDPALDVAIATRSAATGNGWELVGGTYDPEHKTISTRTTHFSDWMAVVTSPGKLVSQAREFLTGLFPGGPPGLTCPGQRLALDVKDPADNGLLACMSKTSAQTFDLEIVNPHGFPLVLELPKPVAVASGNSKPATLGGSVWTAALEARRGRPMLAPGSKRTFTVDGSWFGKDRSAQDRTVTASVDVPTFVFDMANFVATLVLGTRLDGPHERTSSTAGPTTRRHQPVDCVFQAGTRLERTSAAAATSDSFLDQTAKTIKDCYGPSTGDAAVAVAKQLGVAVGRSVVRFLFRGVDLLLNAGEIRDRLREFFSTVNILAAKDDYHPTVALYPELTAQVADEARATGRCHSPSGWNKINPVAWTTYFACRVLLGLIR
jgi:hypothetical protein